jgi:hypothetical protein
MKWPASKIYKITCTVSSIVSASGRYPIRRCVAQHRPRNGRRCWTSTNRSTPSDLKKWCYTYFCETPAKDRSEKPEVRWTFARAGLGTDSLVAPRHAAKYFHKNLRIRKININT